nr:monodehydroascorbate reductase [Tanacetum cinerariifolium]
DQFRKKYPHLFSEPVPSSSAAGDCNIPYSQEWFIPKVMLQIAEEILLLLTGGSERVAGSIESAVVLHRVCEEIPQGRVIRENNGLGYKMADVTAPSGQAPAMAPPVRTNDQILPRIRWVPIGKSNCYLDLEKSQGNPIYKIAVDLLKNTNFFRAFTASSTISSIYIQQFWDMVQYDKKAGSYMCQLDKQWFVLTKDTLREALQITPINNNQPFIGPPSYDALINFVNELGYPKLVRNMSNVVTNDIFQPWRALITFINLCLVGKTSGFERPRAPVLQILWGIVKQANIDYVERIWEEFTQSIHTFIEDKRNLSRHTTGEKKATLIVIPSILAKGTKREVFGMPIPGSLITTDIQEASCYREYLENVAKYRRYLAGETARDQDSPTLKPTKPARKPKSIAPPRPSAKKRSLKNVAESVAEDEPTKEPQVAAEDTDLQKALEESMKTAYAATPQGPLPPVVIREPESGKYQPLLKVPGKGKAKTGSDAGAQDEGQAGSNPDETIEGQAGPDPSNAGADVHSIPSLVVHARSDCEHMDLDVANVSPQPSTEQLDEGFTATAYPKLQENLKLTVEEHVLLEEPTSSSGTLSSLQHLSKDISFGDLFFSDKPSDTDKNAKTEVKSMVNVPIQQALSSISLMTSSIIDLTSRPESPKVHQQFKATTTETTTTTTTLLSPQAQQQSIAEVMMMKRIGELEHIMANLIQVNKDMEERLEKHGACLYTLERLDIPQQVSKAVSEVVTDAVDWAMQAPLQNRFRDLPEADMKEILHQRIRESPKMPPGSPSHPPPPPPPAGPSGASEAPEASGSSHVPPPPPPPLSTNQESLSKGSAAPSSSKTAASAKYQAWTTADIRLRWSISLTFADLEIDEDMAPDEQAQSSDDEDIGSVHIPKVNFRQDWWKPFEEERPTTPEPAWSIRSSDMPVLTNNWASALASNYSPPLEDSLLVQTGDIATFMDWFCKRHRITELKPQDLEGPLLTDSMDDPILRHNVSKPLPLGGPPGQVTIQSDFFFNKDLEYLRYGSKGRRPTLSISKMKAAYYPDVGLEQMVPDQFWIEEECKYDIAAMYGHLNHLPPKDKKILTTSVNQWTRHLVIRQRVKDFQLGIESYQTQLNLTKPQWDATGFEYKHDYTVIDSLKAVMFQDKYGVHMMMRFNEIHKFSDGTMQQIDEALDYRVKEFMINMMNPGLNTRFWTGKDVDRSKAFMFAIQKRLKKRRIFRNLESFIGGRVREGDCRLLKRTD